MKKRVFIGGTIFALLLVASCNPKEKKTKENSGEGTLKVDVTVNPTMKQETISVSIPVYSSDTVKQQKKETL